MNIAPEPVHSGTAQKGEFVPDNPDFYRYELEGHEGLRIDIRIREAKRGNDFNAYYWAGIVKVFTDFFNKEKTFGRIVTKEWVHELLAAKFLGFSQQVIPGGEVVMMRNKSSTLTKREFWDYVEYCKNWGEEFFNLTFPEKTKEENI